MRLKVTVIEANGPTASVVVRNEGSSTRHDLKPGDSCEIDGMHVQMEANDVRPMTDEEAEVAEAEAKERADAEAKAKKTAPAKV